MSDNKALVESLNKFLADSYVLYVKTQNYHWNVTGPNFAGLHTLFETQYTDLAASIDVIAERVRAIGAFPPGNLSKYTALSDIDEQGDNVPDSNTMVKTLAEDQHKVIKSAQSVLEEAEKLGDEATADLAIQRITQHEKNAWMLESSAA